MAFSSSIRLKRISAVPSLTGESQKLSKVRSGSYQEVSIADFPSPQEENHYAMRDREEDPQSPAEGE
jgi:hypothetical protein